MDFMATFDDELIYSGTIKIDENNMNRLEKKDKKMKVHLLNDLLKNEKNIYEIRKFIEKNDFIFEWRNFNNESILYFLLKVKELSQYKKNLIQQLILMDKKNQLECISNKTGKNCLMLSLENEYNNVNILYSKYEYDIYHHDKNNKSIFSYIFTEDFLVYDKFSLSIIQDLILKYEKLKIENPEKSIQEFENQNYGKIIDHINEYYIEYYIKHIDFCDFFSFINFDFTNMKIFELLLNSIHYEVDIIYEKGFEELNKFEGTIDLINIETNSQTWIEFLINLDCNALNEEQIIRLLDTNKFVNSKEEESDDEEESDGEDSDSDSNSDNDNKDSNPKYIQKIIKDIKKLIDNEYYTLMKKYLMQNVLKHSKFNNILQNETFMNLFTKTPKTLQIMGDLVEYENINKNTNFYLTIPLFVEFLEYIYELNMKNNDNDSDDELLQSLEEKELLKNKFNENFVHLLLNKLEEQYSIKQSNNRTYTKLSCSSFHQCNKKMKRVYEYENNRRYYIEICKKYLSKDQLERVFHILSVLNYESVFNRLMKYHFDYENYFDILKLLNKNNNRFLDIFINQKRVQTHIDKFIKKSNEWDYVASEKCEEECIVCLDNIEKSYICCTQCKQKIHSKCALKWFELNSTCMLCRKSMVSVKNKLENIEKLIFYEFLNDRINIK